VDIAVILAHMQ
jgi:hypothetical protein